MSHLTYTDKDGNDYKLVFEPYVKGGTACRGCAFKFGNSSACRSAKSCTPTDGNGVRLVGAGYLWKKV
jgi:hypothetical protein